MTRWNLVVGEETDRSLRSHLARTGGKKGDLSRFVERAVRQAIFWETVDSVKARNAQYDQDEILAAVDAGVLESRADRS